MDGREEIRVNVPEGTQEKVEEASEKVKSMASEAKEKMKGAYESAREQVKETMESLKCKSFDDVVDDVSGYIKENPGRFLLITFGLGLAAGLLMRNNKNHRNES